MLKINRRSSHKTLWCISLAQLDIEVHCKKGKDDHHADHLSRLLTGSPTVRDVEDEIPSIVFEEAENELYIETIYFTAAVDLIENDFDKVEKVLEVKEPKNRLEPIYIEEFISSQHNDAL